MEATVNETTNQVGKGGLREAWSVWLQRLGRPARGLAYIALAGAYYVFGPTGIATTPLAQLTLGDLVLYVVYVAVGCAMLYSLFRPNPRRDIREAWGYLGLVLILASAVGLVFYLQSVPQYRLW